MSFHNVLFLNCSTLLSFFVGLMLSVPVNSYGHIRTVSSPTCNHTFFLGNFVCFVALRPKSTAMVIAGRSVHLTTLFPGQA